MNGNRAAFSTDGRTGTRSGAGPFPLCFHSCEQPHGKTGITTLLIVEIIVQQVEIRLCDHAVKVQVAAYLLINTRLVGLVDDLTHDLTVSGIECRAVVHITEQTVVEICRNIGTFINGTVRNGVPVIHRVIVCVGIEHGIRAKEVFIASVRLMVLVNQFIVPGNINMIPLTVQLDNIPCMIAVSGNASDILCRDACLFQKKFVAVGIALADRS